MGELRQFHPNLKILQIKELSKGDFLIIGDSVQDIVILQSEYKMKAALGKNVKVSLAVKVVPTDIMDSDFKNSLI